MSSELTLWSTRFVEKSAGIGSSGVSGVSGVSGLSGVSGVSGVVFPPNVIALGHGLIIPSSCLIPTKLNSLFGQVTDSILFFKFKYKGMGGWKSFL